MQEIKECPYCGSDNARMYSSVIKGSQVICQDCMMRGPSGHTDAIAKWNSLPRKSDVEELKSYIAQLEQEKSEYYKWFDKLAEACGVFKETDPGKPETFQVIIGLFTRLEKEANWLADALVSPFINPDDHKDSEYWRQAARDAVNNQIKEQPK